MEYNVVRNIDVPENFDLKRYLIFAVFISKKFHQFLAMFYSQILLCQVKGML